VAPPLADDLTFTCDITERVHVGVCAMRSATIVAGKACTMDTMISAQPASTVKRLRYREHMDTKNDKQVVSLLNATKLFRLLELLFGPGLFELVILCEVDADDDPAALNR
jgi:hypothetical protein